MIFVDANVPMYLVGGDPVAAGHAVALVARITADGSAVVSSAEVLQEILHRYSALERVEEADHAFAALDTFVDRMFPLEPEDVVRACRIRRVYPTLQARDCTHLATMERYGISRIASYDRGFDAVPGVERLT
jgi:predicted nucleic acid-binding protein